MTGWRDKLPEVRGTLRRVEPHEAAAEAARGAYLVDTRPEFQRRASGTVPGGCRRSPRSAAATPRRRSRCPGPESR